MTRKEHIEANKEVTVWGMGTIRSLRVYWTLEELGIKYDSFPVHPRSGQTYTPEFLKLNPRHKVPVLKHKGLVITQSAAIIDYLSDAFAVPEGFLAPRSAKDRVRLREWSFFVMAELDAHTLYVIRRHVYLKHLYGEAHTAVCAAEAYFHDQLDAVASSVGQPGPYLLGDKFSTADILLASCLDWAAEYGLAVPQPVYDYHLRCVSRPAYLRALKTTFPDTPPPDMTPKLRPGKWDPNTSVYSGTMQ